MFIFSCKFIKRILVGQILVVSVPTLIVVRLKFLTRKDVGWLSSYGFEIGGVGVVS